MTTSREFTPEQIRKAEKSLGLKHCGNGYFHGPLGDEEGKKPAIILEQLTGDDLKNALLCAPQTPLLDGNQNTAADVLADLKSFAEMTPQELTAERNRYSEAEAEKCDAFDRGRKAALRAVILAVHCHGADSAKIIRMCLDELKSSPDCEPDAVPVIGDLDGGSE